MIRLLFVLRKIEPKRLILILSFVVGIASGFAAVILKNLIHFIQYALTSWISTGNGSLLFFAYPVIGIFFTVLFVKYFVKDNISHEHRIPMANSNTTFLQSFIFIGFV